MHRVKLVTRLGTLFGAVFGLLMMTATPSFAAVGLTVTDPAILQAGGGGLYITGTVNCAYTAFGQITSHLSDHDTITVSAAESVTGGLASGSTTTGASPCDGATHPWTPAASPAAGVPPGGVTVPDSNDHPFVAGTATTPATAAVNAYYQACTLGQSGLTIECQQGSQGATIHVVPFTPPPPPFF
jgi:hypothetical protein